MLRRNFFKALGAVLLTPIVCNAAQPAPLKGYRICPDIKWPDTKHPRDTKRIQWSYLEVWTKKHGWTPTFFLRKERDGNWTLWQWNLEAQQYQQQRNGANDPHWPPKGDLV